MLITLPIGLLFRHLIAYRCSEGFVITQQRFVVLYSGRFCPFFINFGGFLKRLNEGYGS